MPHKCFTLNLNIVMAYYLNKADQYNFSCGGVFLYKNVEQLCQTIKVRLILYTFYVLIPPVAYKGSGEVWYRQDTKRGSNTPSTFKRSPQTPPIKCKL